MSNRNKESKRAAFNDNAEFKGLRLVKMESEVRRMPDLKTTPLVSVDVSTTLGEYKSKENQLELLVHARILIRGKKEEQDESDAVELFYINADYRLYFDFNTTIDQDLAEQITEEIVHSLMAPYYQELYHSMIQRFDIPIVRVAIVNPKFSMRTNEQKSS